MALIPKGVKQVVLLVTSVKGMAPMLQMIYTLLEARRRRLRPMHRQHRSRFRPPYAELERLSKLHPDKLVVEPVDVGGTFAQGARVIESVSQQAE